MGEGLDKDQEVGVLKLGFLRGLLSLPLLHPVRVPGVKGGGFGPWGSQQPPERSSVVDRKSVV